MKFSLSITHPIVSLYLPHPQKACTFVVPKLYPYHKCRMSTCRRAEESQLLKSSTFPLLYTVSMLPFTQIFTPLSFSHMPRLLFFFVFSSLSPFLCCILSLCLGFSPPFCTSLSVLLFLISHSFSFLCSLPLPILLFFLFFAFPMSHIISLFVSHFRYHPFFPLLPHVPFVSYIRTPLPSFCLFSCLYFLSFTTLVYILCWVETVPSQPEAD